MRFPTINLPPSKKLASCYPVPPYSRERGHVDSTRRYIAICLTMRERRNSSLLTVSVQKPPRLPFLGTRHETPTVTTFRFGIHERFAQRQPGQYCSVWIEGVEDPRGSSRLFTISSSPTEKEFITITTRLRGSPFKERLLSAKPGEEFQVRGPFGKFVLDTGRPAVMLAAGIGITPLRSMIRYAADQGLKQPIVLFYSNRIPEEIVFREELERLSHTYRTLKVVTTITRLQDSHSHWEGRTGRIDAALVKKETESLSNPLYYVSGPPATVEGLTMILGVLEVGRENLRTEKFDGY